MKGQPRRNWTDAELRRGRCIACLKVNAVELAHVIGREHDRKSGYRVLASRVAPLCGPFPAGCHGAYDRHELDIWHLLDFEQQAQAIEDAGGYWLAIRRCAPVAYREFNERQAA